MSAPPAGISIRAFARLEGVSDKLVRRALENGYLQALPGGTLSPADVGTGWCERNRKRADSGADTPADSADTPPPVRTQVSAPGKGVRTELEAQPHGGALTRKYAEGDEADPIDGDAAMTLVLSGGAKLAEAERLRANANAVRAVLAARRESGELIEIADAERVFFETNRAARDSWINWPARIGPLLAADLDVPADKVTEVLTAHVHQHLAELGEPEPDFSTDTA